MIAGHEDIYEDLKSVRCLAQTRRLPLLCAARQRFNSMGSKVTHRAVTEHDNANRFGTHSQVTESGQCASFEAQCAATLLHVGKKNQVRQTTEDLPANKQVSEPLRMEIEAKFVECCHVFFRFPSEGLVCGWLCLRSSPKCIIYSYIYMCIWMHVWIQKYQVRPNIDLGSKSSHWVDFAKFTI